MAMALLPRSRRVSGEAAGPSGELVPRSADLRDIVNASRTRTGSAVLLYELSRPWRALGASPVTVALGYRSGNPWTVATSPGGIRKSPGPTVVMPSSLEHHRPADREEMVRRKEALVRRCGVLLLVLLLTLQMAGPAGAQVPRSDRTYADAGTGDHLYYYRSANCHDRQGIVVEAGVWTTPVWPAGNLQLCFDQASVLCSWDALLANGSGSLRLPEHWHWALGPNPETTPHLSPHEYVLTEVQGVLSMTGFVNTIELLGRATWQDRDGVSRSGDFRLVAGPGMNAYPQTGCNTPYDAGHAGWSIFPHTFWWEINETS